MESKTIWIVSSVAIGLFVIFVLMFSALYSTFSITPLADQTTTYSQVSSLLTNTNTFTALTPTGNAITSLSSTKYNMTYLTFDGTTSRVHIDDSVDFNNPWSVSFWLNKSSTIDSAPGYMVCKADSTGSQRTFQFHTNTGNDVVMIVYHNGSTINTTTSQINNLIGANTWYHIVGVWNGSSTLLYMNGLLQDNDTAASQLVFSGTANFTLGNCVSNSGFYNGSLDEVMLYNRALNNTEVNDLYLNGHGTNITSTGITGYYDNFSSYAVGNNTMIPYWLPQYSNNSDITSDGKLLLKYYNAIASDKDQHITLNRSEISKGVQNLTAKFQFNVVGCNSTFKGVQGISNIGASSYFFYADGNNFLSMEVKTNATSATCGNGTEGQFMLYKRVGGVTTNLLSQTLYTFNLSTDYNATMIFKVKNDTHYNFTAYITKADGTDVVSGTAPNNITTSDVRNGDAFLLEVAGTNTTFDYVNITRNFTLINPTNFYRLNENTGTITYDFADSSNGLNSGANYTNDNVNVSLIQNTDYLFAGSTYTLSNPTLNYSQLLLNYNYVYYNNSLREISGNLSSGFSTGFSTMTLIFGILGIVIVIAALVLLFVKIRSLEVERVVGGI